MNLDDLNLDFERLKADLTPVIADAIEHLIKGAKKDVEQFAIDIGRDMIEALVGGGQDIRDQLTDQLMALAEISDIRLRNSTWLVVSTVVSSLTRAAVAGALASFL